MLIRKLHVVIEQRNNLCISLLLSKFGTSAQMISQLCGTLTLCRCNYWNWRVTESFAYGETCSWEPTAAVGHSDVFLNLNFCLACSTAGCGHLIPFCKDECFFLFFLFLFFSITFIVHWFYPREATRGLNSIDPWVPEPVIMKCLCESFTGIKKIFSMSPHTILGEDGTVGAVCKNSYYKSVKK